MSSRTNKRNRVSSKEHYQVIDGHDKYHRKVGRVIAKHDGTNFPICLEFEDGTCSVYYAYQVRQVLIP